MHGVDIKILTPAAAVSGSLGRHVEHDSRSRQYAFKESSTPRPVVWPSAIPVLDQGNLGACTGFATVACMGHTVFKATVPQEDFTEDDAVDVYHLATTLDSIPGTYPPYDTGSTGLAAAKAAKKLGWISGYKHIFSLNSLLSALQVGPVIVGTNWYESMFHPESSGVVTVDERSGLAGGHEYCCDEITHDGYLGFTNSWGPNWGEEGRFFIDIMHFEWLLSQDGDATIFTPITQPAPQPEPVPTPEPEVDADVLAAYTSLRSWASKNNIQS